MGIYTGPGQLAAELAEPEDKIVEMQQRLAGDVVVRRVEDSEQVLRHLLGPVCQGDRRLRQTRLGHRRRAFLRSPAATGVIARSVAHP